MTDTERMDWICKLANEAEEASMEWWLGSGGKWQLAVAGTGTTRHGIQFEGATLRDCIDAAMAHLGAVHK